MEAIEMLKTQDPKEIPNGTRATISNPLRDGLNYVVFDNGYAAYVYKHEVRSLECSGN
ncbi:hypothetical protein [Teredinibacter turnerae]|uniref:hypothetical protein n=1 Tax=Teredinibacter turnerae TaxID=2426 RepID=UPI00037C3DD2|nr:hypothetical protein [Teredinibacter turnerae]